MQAKDKKKIRPARDYRSRTEVPKHIFLGFYSKRLVSDKMHLKKFIVFRKGAFFHL